MFESKALISDPGCNSHILCDKGFFVSLHDVSSKICVNSNNSVSPVKRQGVAKRSLPDKQGVSHVLNLSDRLYVPDHSQKLLSVSALGQKDAKVVFDATCEHRCSDKFFSPFVQRNGLYVTKDFQFVLQTFLARVNVILIFGIAECVTITSPMLKSYQSRQGTKLHNSSFSESFCGISAANKLNRKPPSSKMALRKSSKLELVYSDVSSPMETNSLGRHRYVVRFIDSYNPFARVYFIKQKSEVLAKFRQFVLMKVYLRDSRL